jgi:hypothetical protein
MEPNVLDQDKSKETYCDKLLRFFKSPLTIYVYDQVFLYII